jgi:hypothetical protein
MIAENKEEKTVNTDEKSEKGKTSSNDVNMIPKARFDQVNEQKKSAELELTSIAEELEKDVPEDMRDLIPNIPAGQKIKWIRQANAKGLFTQKETATLDSKRAAEKKTINYDDMSTHNKIASGYKS